MESTTGRAFDGRRRFAADPPPGDAPAADIDRAFAMAGRARLCHGSRRMEETQGGPPDAELLARAAQGEQHAHRRRFVRAEDAVEFRESPEQVLGALLGAFGLV